MQDEETLAVSLATPKHSKPVLTPTLLPSYSIQQMQKDPARLTGKGGILLKEEKLRKRLNRDKPRVSAPVFCIVGSL
jgi:hypothetical protein